MTPALKFIFGGYRKVSPFFFIKDMRRIYTYILIITAILISLSNAAVCRAENISGESASIRNTTDNSEYDFRVQNLKNYLLKYDSPLSPYAADFVAYADANGLDYRLVPAITGVESTFGKHIPLNSYNAYGWANGDYSFTSWEDSIAHVSETLKTSYIDKGAPTISKIARRYAPPSTTWGSKVTYFVGKIDTLPLNFDI
jgi:hypothetical protein